MVCVVGVLSAPIDTANGGVPESGAPGDDASIGKSIAPDAAVTQPPVSCFFATEELTSIDVAQIRAEREAHLAATFRVDSLYRDVIGSADYTVPTDLSEFVPSPVPIAGLPALARFGNRIHPIYRTLRWHNGIDVVHPVGVPVQALAPGTVVAARSIGGYGNAIVVDHGDGFSTVSAHLSAFNVAVGDVVEAGQLIGQIGRTGRVTGAHLHFETRLGGVPVNPRWFIQDLPEPRIAIEAHEEAQFQIQRLYQQAFGRLPDAAALTFWIDQCRNGRTLEEVAAWIASGDEFVTRFAGEEPVSVDALVDAAQSDDFVDEIASELIDPSVRRLYVAVLGREPESAGGYYWTARFQGGDSLVELAALIGNSPEYEARFGLSDTEAFVEQTYRIVFGREPDAGGLEFWVERAEATSRWHVLVGFAESPEGQARL